MNFPPYWAKGSCQGFACWRWSHRSVADAQSLADDAARKLADRFKAGDMPEHGYGYPDRPFRELVIRELKDHSGGLTAVVTRNSQGCLVLNAARVMFVDVDLPEPGRPGGFLKRLFGKPEPSSGIDQIGNAIARVEMWTRNHPEWAWRVYRTRAGLRLLATHALFEPDAEETESVFEALGADPLYRRLCRTQKCFRARLTPKPWRCGIHKKPERWPWLNAKAQSKFESWASLYENTCRNWATCELIKTLGSDSVHPDVKTLVDLHDDATRVGSKVTLA